MQNQKTIGLFAVAAVALLALGATWLWRGRDPGAFVTAPAARVDLVRAISATGAVNPVVIVQVGTYVSGPITEINCDFNTEVAAGQRCALIDQRPYRVALDQARANLEAAEAQLVKDRASLDYTRRVHESNRGMVETGAVSRREADNDLSNYEQAQAQVKLDEATIAQRKAALDAAQVNLDYTEIVSPVDGIVVARNVDVGQTVAASFQTPTLFLIARDLTKMQVDASVSESDVGGVKVGQRAEFTVEAFPARTFAGQVAQIRQAPITVQNVVTYDVVIGVDNGDLALLPGMTANVRVVTDERDGALAVPLQALRFDPRGAAGDHPSAQSGAKQVWVMRDSEPVAVAVQVGIDDGTSVEITGGDLQAGDRVLVDRAGQRGRSGEPRRSPFAAF
ncbi:MAG TPA: efflux RND transporter periplasmic adaptor subunit [Myxococcota bacterium]|nr:efflux RND transporter periplasmic adaptor subunit [Myxococcota bacterium]